MSDIPGGLQAIEELFRDEFVVPDALKAPPQTDSPEYLAHILFVRAMASILYVREVLTVFSLIAKSTPHAGTSVLFARALAELAALTYYLRKNIRDAVRSSRLDIALDWAHKSFSGNRYLNKFFTPDSDAFKDLPKPKGEFKFVDPMDLAKATKSYSADVLREEQPRYDYEFLSEMSHPNSAAINQYLRLDLRTRTVHFSREPREEYKWDAYVLKYAGRAGLEIVELINLAKEINPRVDEKTS